MHTLLVVLLSSVGTNQLLLRAEKEQKTYNSTGLH
jgi:hypothetical protein